MELFLLRLLLSIHVGIFCVLTTTEGTQADDTSIEFLGCYADNSTRPLSGALKYFAETLTREVCTDYCHREGFRYAGLQTSYQCFCGNSGYDKYGRSHGCSSPCDGNSEQICGGQWHNAVYRIGTETTTTSINCQPESGAGVQTFNASLIVIITALAFVSLVAIVAVSVLIAKRKEICSTPESSKVKSLEAGHHTSPQETGQRNNNDNAYMNLMTSRPSHVYASGEPEDEDNEYDYAQCDTGYGSHSGKGMYVTDLRLEAPNL